MKEMNIRNEINDLSTGFEDQNNNSEENNGIKASLNQDMEYLKVKYKIEEIVVKILFIEQFILFICKDKDDVKYPNYLKTTLKTKIIIKYKNNINLNNLKEIKLNADDCFISEAKEDKNYVFICQDNGIYKLVDFNKLELLSNMKINFLIQINKNKYVVSNNNGIFLYEGSILEISRENLEIKNKKISTKKYLFGAYINESAISFSKNDESMVYNLNKMEVILEIPKGFSENCHSFLSYEIISLQKKEKKEYNNILLFGYEIDNEYGFYRVVIENGEEQFLKTKKFQVYCFIQIVKYKKKIIEAFSEEYNEDHNYILAGGYDYNFNENTIKLFIFNKYYNEIEKEKYIMIEKNEIYRELLKIQNIYQISYKDVLINCSEGMKGESIYVNIMNLETIERQVYENESLPYNLEKILEEDTFDLKIIDTLNIKIRPLIKNIYPLKDNYFIIVQQGKFSLVYYKDSSFTFCYNINFKDLIISICQINEKEVYIIKTGGLYKLEFYDNNVKLNIINNNDMNYRLISKIANKDNNNNSNEFLVSLHKKEAKETKEAIEIKEAKGTIEIKEAKGTFLVPINISSITCNHLKTKICDIVSNIGEIIEINNNIFILLITNTGNKGILHIYDINNNQNYYKQDERIYFYILSKNYITIFRTNEDSNNHIILCAAKRENKNVILAINMTMPLNNSFEHYYETNLEISCIAQFKNEKNGKKKSFSYFCIGGINANNKIEISLNKIIYLDAQGKNCLSFQFINSVIYDEERINSIIFMYQPIKDKSLMIVSNNNIYIMDIKIKEEEEEKLLQ